MKEVFYKGNPYAYQVVETKGKRQYQLFQSGELQHVVEENELDIKSVVSMILDSYYKNIKPAVKSTVLS